MSEDAHNSPTEINHLFSHTQFLPLSHSSNMIYGLSSTETFKQHLSHIIQIDLLRLFSQWLTNISLLFLFLLFLFIIFSFLLILLCLFFLCIILLLLILLVFLFFFSLFFFLFFSFLFFFLFL